MLWPKMTAGQYCFEYNGYSSAVDAASKLTCSAIVQPAVSAHDVEQ